MPTDQWAKYSRRDRAKSAKPDPEEQQREAAVEKFLATAQKHKGPTVAEINAGRHTMAQLAAWGVPWPPPKGWRKRLLRAAGGVQEKPKSKTAKRQSARQSRRGMREAAKAAMPNLVAFCAENGIQWTDNANGVHLIFELDRNRVEWWPGTGKMAINHGYRDAKVVCDPSTFMEILRDTFVSEQCEATDEFRSMFTEKHPAPKFP